MANTKRNLMILGIVSTAIITIIVITVVVLYFTGVIGKSSKPKPSNSSVSQSNNPIISIDDIEDKTEEQKQDKIIEKPVEIVNFIHDDEPDP